MNLYLKEIGIEDKEEIIKLCEEISNSNDLIKFEGISNFKQVNKDNYKDFLVELEHDKNIKLYKPHLVDQSTYVLTDDDGHIYGGTNIRHELNDELLKCGGNIGYSIKPSERGKGYATLMLKLTLEKCKLLDMKKVLITCREENLGSRKVIENNGGIYENSLYKEENGYTYRRYWINLDK